MSLMTRSVEVYLKSENDAESVRASLQTAKVKNLFIDEMGEDSEARMFTPFFPTNIGSSGMPSSVGPIVPLVEMRRLWSMKMYSAGKKQIQLIY